MPELVTETRNHELSVSFYLLREDLRLDHSWFWTYCRMLGGTVGGSSTDASASSEKMFFKIARHCWTANHRADT